MTLSHVGLAPVADCPALRDRCQQLRAQVAALRDCPDAAFARRFPSTVASVEAAFRHEEALLDERHDACLHPRLADHATVLCALHRTAECVERGDLALGRQVIDALDALLAVPPAPAY